ncbi:hypothetical protein DBR11_21325 [Pedobacter sp. HMWF019]|nr:hypothetical protein DBR11_21325 [Pedobacter sp. HMWF019]
MILFVSSNRALVSSLRIKPEKTNIMKTLSNISPFILLLVPVFVVLLLTFTTSINSSRQNDEASVKRTINTRGPVVKVDALFSK